MGQQDSTGGNFRALTSGKFEDMSGEVIGALIDVHRWLGPGLVESAYEACFCHELRVRDLPFERQHPVGISYKEVVVDCAFRIDVLVDGKIVVELKSVERVLPVHVAQVLTYMKLSGVSTGLLVNFNVPSLRMGLRRLSLPLSRSL